MLTNALTPGNRLQEMLDTLLRQVDGNKDGVVSTDEFAIFLNRVLTGKIADSLPGPGSPASSPNASASSAAPMGDTGSVKFEGFDFSQPNDVSKSAKYAFAQAATASGTMPRTKAEAEAWFNQHIRGELERLGHKVNWVKGDKFQFTNWQGTYTIDFVRGADGPNPALAWQVE